MGCPKIAYNQYCNPAMRCVYNAADGQESYAGTYSYNTTLKDGIYYIHPDHQGSFVTITDATGTIKQKCSFDAWANRAAGIERGWDFWENPLDVNHVASASRGVYYDYRIPEQRDLVNSLELRAKWYDYLDPLGLYIGIGNALYYRKHRVK